MVSIYPECTMPDGDISDSFPCILRIQPLDKSFYTALGYSVLFKLACVSSGMKKEVSTKITQYLKFELTRQNINTDLDIQPEVNQGVEMLPKILEEVISPSKSLQEIESLLKANAKYICSGFQYILAAIFARSSKIQEAQDILDGKKVLFQNKYYFENFAKSLALRIVIHSPDEPEIISIDEGNSDRINVELFVLSKLSCEFAIMRHHKEIDFISTNDNSGINDMPFIFLRKSKHAPIMNSGPFLNSMGVNNNPVPNLPGGFNNPAPNLPVGFNNPVPNLPGGFNNTAPNLPGGFNNPVPNLPGGFNNPVPNLPGGLNNYSQAPNLPPNNPQPQYYSNPAPENVPQNPHVIPSYPSQSNINPKVASNSGYSGGASSKPEDTFIDLILPIILSNSPFFTKSEVRSLKKKVKTLRTKEKSKLTENLKLFKESSENYCKNNHDSSNFVLFKACQKRHCVLCLKDSGEFRIICDCKKEVANEDLSFLLGKSLTCVICGLSIDDPSQKVGTTHFMHRECALKI